MASRPTGSYGDSAPPPVAALPVVWRPLLGRLVARVLFPVVLALWVGLGYVMWSSVRASDLMLFGVFGVIVLTVLYLVGRPRLSADERGLTVVNVFRRHELDWAEVLGASMAEGEPWPTLDLSDGDTLATMGIQASDGNRAHRNLAELQVLVADRGTSTPSD